MMTQCWNNGSITPEVNINAAIILNSTKDVEWISEIFYKFFTFWEIYLHSSLYSFCHH